MSNKSIFRSAFSFDFFVSNFNRFSDSEYMTHVTGMYLLEARRLGVLSPIDNKVHITVLEKRWNNFILSTSRPAPDLVGAIADRIYCLFLIIKSKIKIKYKTQASYFKSLRRLYSDLADGVDSFNESEYYDLIKIASHCDGCGDTHSIDLNWGRSLVAKREKVQKPYGKQYSHAEVRWSQAGLGAMA